MCGRITKLDATRCMAESWSNVAVLRSRRHHIHAASLVFRLHLSLSFFFVILQAISLCPINWNGHQVVTVSELSNRIENDHAQRPILL